MRLPAVFLILATISLAPSLAQAECDFDTPTGSCSGSVKLLSSGGAKPSFSAEIEITSSAGACSKVEYSVNATPYTSVIRDTGSERESLFGSNPIHRTDIEVSKCTAYEKTSSGSQRQSADAASHISVDGTWYSIDDLGESGTHESMLTITENNGKIFANEKMVAYWGPPSNRKQYSEVMTSGARWTGRRDGNTITTESGGKLTIVDGGRISTSYGIVWAR